MNWSNKLKQRYLIGRLLIFGASEMKLDRKGDNKKRLFLVLAAFFILLLKNPASAQDAFYPIAIDQDKLEGVVDFSFMNHPLTSKDRIFIRDGHFYRIGKDLKPNTADDERVRFFGVNLSFEANFPEPKDARRIAKRLSRLGVNLVRLHHMDTSPDKDPKQAASILTDGHYPSLNHESIKRLRVFLDELKAEGIYANLNLRCGYAFRPSVDGVPALPGGESISKQYKPLHIFYPQMVDLQVKFVHDLLKALQLKDDSVLAMVEIINESSLIFAWQKNELDNIAVGEYKSELQRQWEDFLKSKKINTPLSSAVQQALYVDFLVSRDRAYLERMADAVRAETDKLTPIAGTQLNNGGLLNIDSQTGLGYFDYHFYHDHYNFPNKQWDQTDWRIRNNSQIGNGLKGFLNMAVVRVKGKPFTVSEFNQPWPNTFGAEMSPSLAVFGAFQDWDALVFFTYANKRNWETDVPTGFNLNGDWGKFPNLGQAAWLFRTGAITPGKSPVDIPVPRAVRLETGYIKLLTRDILSFFKNSIGFNPDIAFLHPVRMDTADIGSVFKNIGLPQPMDEYLADTGEIRYSPSRRIFLINSLQAAGVIGFLKLGQKVTAGPIDIEIGPSASRGFISLLVTARDKNPLVKSGNLLISLPGYTLRSKTGAAPPRPHELSYYNKLNPFWVTLKGETTSPSEYLNKGSAPVWMERIETFLTLRTSAKSIAVYPLDGKGARTHAIPASDIEAIDKGFRIHLQSDKQHLALAPWYEAVLQY